MSAILGINLDTDCDYRHYAMGATAHVVRRLVEWERARMVGEVYMASNEKVHSLLLYGRYTRYWIGG